VEDEIEVVGTAIRAPSMMSFAPYDLVNANVRIIGHQEKVEPVPTSFDRVLSGEHTSDLVQVRGRFLTWQTMPLPGGLWRNTLLLKSEGKKLTAVHQGTLANPFDSLKPDDDVLIQAVVDRATPDSPLQLRVLAPADAKSLGYSSDLLTQRFWFWTICGVALVLILSGWIVGLRRSNRIKSKAAEELRAASEAARASEQRWKLLFEQSPLSVQIFAPDGQTKRFNEAWQKLFRLSEEQGYAFNVLKDPDLNASGAVNAIRKAFEGEVVHVPPVPYPVPGDPPETRWIGGVLYPVKNESGEVIEVVTIHNDITQMKHAEETMQALNQTLEQRVQERTAELEVARADLSKALDQERELSDLKSRFVSMVSHEFRTPLGVTMSAVEIMRHFDDKLPPEKRRELCDEIHGATRNMAGLMEQVLVLGRVEAGKLGYRPAALDVESLIGKLIDESLSATNRRCPIKLECEGDLHDAVGDEALVRHILSNLIHNAVKYSSERVDVCIRVSRRGSDLVCEVQDHGIGIPEKDRAHLYEAFHRCTNVGDIPGTGLGLVIVKRCVDLHNGSIELHSEVGKGTTFIVRLPMFDLSRSSSHSQ
jgi:PAS domain S-box-containing protein